MQKIAVLGDLDSICGYAFLGVDIFPFSNEEIESACKLLRQLSNDEYAIVYITEMLYAKITDCIEAVLKNNKMIVIIPIPGLNFNTGIGTYNIKNAVEKAVGADILSS